MKNAISIAFPISLILLFFSCNSGETKQEVITSAIKADSSAIPDAAHNSANSLDWEGEYKGILPCADCEGIETEITINRDMTYSQKSKHLGKNPDPFMEKGNFEWNKDGNQITLTPEKGESTRYWVAENKIVQLDKSGNKITGDLADKYVLTKQTESTMNNTPVANQTPNATLVETYWKLTELMGKPIPAPATGEKEVHITLKKQDNGLQGFAGCNNLTGTYELKEGNRIVFSKVATTLMACPDMNLEDEFKKALGSADNYSIKGDTLSLNKARMAPLARFQAVYLK